MIWLAAGAGLLILLLGGAVTLQTSRLDACHAEGKAKEVVIAKLGDDIKQQNDAIAAAGEATRTARLKGAVATAKAQKEAAGHAGEVARLSGLLKQAGGGGKSCADGVADARKGLAP